MGCLFKSIFILPLIILLFFPLLLFSLFLQTRRFNRRQTAAGRENRGATKDGSWESQPNQRTKPEKPINESEVEFIEFEEIKDNSGR